MNNKTITKYTSEQVYDYVMNNFGCHKTGVQYSAYLHFDKYIYQEYGDSAIEARSKLANELSKSIYIRKNIQFTPDGKY